MSHWQVSPGWVKSQRDPGQVMPVKKSPHLRDSPHLQVHWERTMSIFGKIMSAIFGSAATAAPAGGGAAAAPAGGSTRGSPSAAPAAPPAQNVDDAPIPDKAGAAHGGKPGWGTRHVHLMQAL